MDGLKSKKMTIEICVHIANNLLSWRHAQKHKKMIGKMGLFGAYGRWLGASEGGPNGPRGTAQVDTKGGV